MAEIELERLEELALVDGEVGAMARELIEARGLRAVMVAGAKVDWVDFNARLRAWDVARANARVRSQVKPIFEVEPEEADPAE